MQWISIYFLSIDISKWWKSNLTITSLKQRLVLLKNSGWTEVSNHNDISLTQKYMYLLIQSLWSKQQGYDSRYLSLIYLRVLSALMYFLLSPLFEVLSDLRSTTVYIASTQSNNDKGQTCIMNVNTPFSTMFMLKVYVSKKLNWLIFLA